MSNKQAYEVAGLTYGDEQFETVERFKNAKRQRPKMGRSRGKAPQSFNGIHRRRRRKLAW